MVALKILLITAGAMIAVSVGGLACRPDIKDRGAKMVALLALVLAIAIAIYVMRRI